MRSFLELVARDILDKTGSVWPTGLDRLTIVFPNKRAALFLDDHLARMSGHPVWSPRYYSISELFAAFSPLTQADQLQLVSRLWRIYCRVTNVDEPLDDFFGWGQMLLTDFSDIDNQMADADRVFANVRDLHELDDASFLTAEQIEVLRQFYDNLSQDPVSQLRQRFLKVWSRLGDVYHAFRRDLRRSSLAYEGMLRRDAVERLQADTTPGDDGSVYIFVGFNALLGVERKLFSLLKERDRAHFYWDYDSYYMPRRRPMPGFEPHEAGHFVAQYLEMFPSELPPALFDNFKRPKHITIASAQTEDIQGRYVSQWLQQQPERMAHGRQTAIVMCNEWLLGTVLHQLPDSLPSLNITTGYPLAATPVASLLQLLAELRTMGYRGAGTLQPEYRYRRHWLNAVMRHPYIMPLAETEDMRQLLLTMHEGLSAVELALDTARWMANVVQLVAKSNDNSTDTSQTDMLKNESLFRAYTMLQRLASLIEQGELPIDIHTLLRLTRQLTATTSIPFHGEPAEGLQVMGMLETRCLDFSHLLLLSASEGQLPRGVNDQSFIPYAVRKAHGLTTPDHRVAIYSYYFHRLLQRADDITICYNAATGDTGKGEMSRFLMQLMVEDTHHHPTRLTLQPALGFTPFRPVPRAKSEQVQQTLRQRFADLLSPTALGRYMRCPLVFYFHYALGIAEPDDDDDDEGAMNQMDFGNVFHEAAQILYRPFAAHKASTLDDTPVSSGLVTAADIDRLLKDPSTIERVVGEAFALVMDDWHGRYSGLQLISREVIIQLLRRLLQLDRRTAPLNIVGLEVDVSRPLHIEAGTFEMDTTIGGRIDRLDIVTTADGQRRLRVVDYKTGSARQPALPSLAAVFDPSQLKNHNDYYLQTMLYADILAQSSPSAPARDAAVSPALLYIQHAAADDYDPVLTLDKQPIADISTLHDDFAEGLNTLVADIFDPAKPFMPTPHGERCLTCPYHYLCSQ